MYGWSACVNILNSCRYTVIMSTGCVVTMSGCVVTIVWVFFKDIGESVAITSQYMTIKVRIFQRLSVLATS